MSNENVWDVVNEQIERSKIKRINWKALLGDSLTKIILRKKMSGLTAEETIKLIWDDPNIQEFVKLNPNRRGYLYERIKISVSSRYAENDMALKLYHKEFQ